MTDANTNSNNTLTIDRPTLEELVFVSETEEIQIDFDNTAYPESYPYPYPNIEPDANIINQHVITQIKTPEEFAYIEPEIDILEPGKLVADGWLEDEDTDTEEDDSDSDDFDFDPHGDLLSKILTARQEMQQEKISIEQKRISVQAELDQQKKLIGQMRHDIETRESQLAEK